MPLLQNMLIVVVCIYALHVTLNVLTLLSVLPDVKSGYNMLQLSIPPQRVLQLANIT